MAATDTPRSTSTPPDPHYHTVSQRVPQWLLDATPQRRQALRKVLPQPLPWLDEARARLPAVVAALREDDSKHPLYAEAVDDVLKQLPSPEAFAEPLLRAAIKDTFGLDLDVRRTFLFNAVRARAAESHLNARDPVARAFQAVKVATQSLLASALQNFEAFEAETDGLRDDRRPSTIFTSETGLPMDSGQTLELLPERFAALCRQLDLGGRYQQRIRVLFEPAPQAGEDSATAAASRQVWFKLFEYSTFRLNLHLARLRDHIDQATYATLLDVTKSGKASPDCRRSVPTLWEVPLNGMVLFTLAGSAGVVVYMPDEPQQPVQAFASLTAFHDALRERLKERTWRGGFLRFVPAREREQLLQRIQRSLYPQVWNPGGWYEERYDPNASLRLGEQALATPLFNALLQRKIAVLKDDGLFHAVPTADQDHKSRQDKIDYFLGVGFNLLNVAAFVVPVLGEVMLVVNAGMLVHEVYEGFHSLAKGEQEEAWGYFMDVGENLAIMAALGVVGAGAQRFEGNLPLAVRSMRPVTLADGSVRLWKPDITPFAYDIRLPADLQPEANGLYDYQGRQWLKLEGRYYSVRTLLGEAPGYRLEHPERAAAYQPVVRPNGNGGWLHEADTPERWHGMQLFRRQGPREAAVSADMAQRALDISGVSEAQLRRSLVDCQRPPALLTDALSRLVLFEQLDSAGLLDADTFATRYRARQADLSDAGRLLQGAFRLPNGLLEEIVAAATPAELRELALDGRVPLRLAEEARRYQQQVRIARACEGLYLDLGVGADSASLFLHALETLPHWSREVGIALHKGHVEGRLLAQIGSDVAAAIPLVWRGQSLAELCAAVFEAIPGEARVALGIDDAVSLRERVLAQPLAPRWQLRDWLGLSAEPPGFRSPMRLADGRLGYPLSGRGGPLFTEDQLLDKLRVLELDDPEGILRVLLAQGLDRAAIDALLEPLLEEMQALRQCLDRWALASANQHLSETRQLNRERIGEALWSHWRNGLLPQIGRPTPRLALWRVQLVDLPTDLPAFLREGVRELLLDEVIQEEGEAHQRVIGEAHLQGLAACFPELTALDIRSGEWTQGLAPMIVQAWPRLRALGLRELRGRLGELDLRALLGLPRLRRLSLRGSRVESMPDTTLHGLTLDHLCLDWLGLLHWPGWLDSTVLLRIGEVSLMNNWMQEVPSALLSDTTAVARPQRIVLRGSQFSHQSLLDMRLAEHFNRRFSFDLDLEPPLEQMLAQHVRERASLQAALRTWADPAVAFTRIGYRQRIAKVLLAFWREDLRGPGTALLCLEDLVLEEFPDNLPAFFAERVHRLDLTRYSAGDGDSLSNFLGRFLQLRELSLISGTPALTSVPECLIRFSWLRELALIRMGMSIDQAAMDTFGRLPMLSSLQLDGNRLGTITDVSMFTGRFLNYLGLAEMQLTHWPDWLDGLLPGGVELLCLDDNQISELPEDILANRRTFSGVAEISLHNNPLTRQTLIDAHRSQHVNRPYSFTLDLPEDIAAMERLPHSSDSESEGAEDSSPEPIADHAVYWETGDRVQDERHQQTWGMLLEQDGARALLGLVNRLRQTADYRSLVTRDELRQRVWSVLSAALDDSDLCLILNGMAEEPLHQASSHETCPDGIRLEFNQMELLVHTRQALRDIPESNRGSALFRLMRGIFRSQTLDRIARDHSTGRDEAEVRLAYRLRWAAELELPLPPRTMLYRGAAEIAPGELDRALAQLQREEGSAGLLAFARQCEFWTAYLREAFAARFNVLTKAYEAAVLKATEDYPDESAAQSAARIEALEARFKEDEQALIDQLTLSQASLER